MDVVEILPKWGKYQEGGAVNVGGKPYQIIYIMAHHESESVWLVIKSKYEQDMFEYDVNYQQGVIHDGASTTK